MHSHSSSHIRNTLSVLRTKETRHAEEGGGGGDGEEARSRCSQVLSTVSIYRIIWLQSESHHHGNVFGGSKSPHYLEAASASYHSTQPEVEKESGEEVEEGSRRGVEGGEKEGEGAWNNWVFIDTRTHETEVDL